MTAVQLESLPAAGAGRRWRRAGALALVALLVGATFMGVAYRRWGFEITQGGRYAFDIRRNHDFGAAALDNGYLNVYEDQLRDNPPAHRKLDYPPLRLAVFEAWAAWTRWTHPQAKEWSPEYSFNAFLMRHNTLLEWLASLAALLIVRHWLREAARAELPLGAGPPGPWTGMFRATLAFLVLWFDPGVLIIAHGWPSPNMWVIPYYLWAVYLCLLDWWFAAGLVIGVGAMLQGQQLFVAGIFVLWPFFAGRPGGALRWICGFALAFAAVAGGWMLTVRPDIRLPARFINWSAVAWIAGSMAGLVLVGLRTTLRRRVHAAWFALPVAGTVVALLWPVAAHGWRALLVAAPLALGLVAVLWWSGWDKKRYALALALALCLFACIPLFGASTAWWEVGFMYGTERFPVLMPGPTNNLCTILYHHFDWRGIHDPVFTLPASLLAGWPASPQVVGMRQFLTGLYVVLLVAGGAALAVQWRRRDRNLLVALVLPWVLFYTILPEISPRYSVFVAGVGAICIGRSAGMWLLVLMFSLLTVQQTAIMMCGGGASGGNDPLFNPQVQAYLRPVYPGIAWAVVLAACVFLWMSFSLSGAWRLRDRRGAHGWRWVGWH